MHPGFYCNPAARYPAEDFHHCSRCRSQLSFQNYFSACIQNAVPARPVSQIQPDRQFLTFNFFDLLCRCGANLLIAGLLYLLRFKRVDNLGAYRIPSETGVSSHLLKSTDRHVPCSVSLGRTSKHRCWAHENVQEGREKNPLNHRLDGSRCVRRICSNYRKFSTRTMSLLNASSCV
jgi:hypothetical protein